MHALEKEALKKQPVPGGALNDEDGLWPGLHIPRAATIAPACYDLTRSREERKLHDSQWMV
jgi:hypothetical protein